MKIVQKAFQLIENYKTGEKNIIIGAVLGLLFGALGLFYISWKMALGFLVFTMVMIVVLPVSLYALLFLGLGLGVFGVQKHNEALATT